MSLEAPIKTGPETDVAELRMAAAYGIEGLKRGIDTSEYDDWLELFGMILEELDKPWNQSRGNFPLKEFVIPEKKEREEIIETLREINEVATELHQKDVEDRDDMEEKIETTIREAEELYDRFEEMEDREMVDIV